MVASMESANLKGVFFTSTQEAKMLLWDGWQTCQKVVEAGAKGVLPEMGGYTVSPTQSIWNCSILTPLGGRMSLNTFFYDVCATNNERKRMTS